MFFFQAEDGIRDLVRSRGLGDVYKRQARDFGFETAMQNAMSGRSDVGRVDMARTSVGHIAVSYTHLTLPTSDLV